MKNDSKKFRKSTILFIVLQNYTLLNNLLYNLYFCKSENVIDNELLNLQL